MPKNKHREVNPKKINDAAARRLQYFEERRQEIKVLELYSSTNLGKTWELVKTARPDELITYCKQRLASFKYPRRLTVLDALPRATTGKILKSRLARPATAE